MILRVPPEKYRVSSIFANFLKKKGKASEIIHLEPFAELTGAKNGWEAARVAVSQRFGGHMVFGSMLLAREWLRV